METEERSEKREERREKLIEIVGVKRKENSAVKTDSAAILHEGLIYRNN